jgi:hypothetical protein
MSILCSMGFHEWVPKGGFIKQNRAENRFLAERGDTYPTYHVIWGCNRVHVHAGWTHVGEGCPATRTTQLITNEYWSPMEQYEDLCKKLNQPNPTKQLANLIEAVSKLYYAAHWIPDRNVDSTALWTAVRDAAGFAPGSAPKFEYPPSTKTQESWVASETVPDPVRASGFPHGEERTTAGNFADAPYPSVNKKRKERKLSSKVAYPVMPKPVPPTPPKNGRITRGG